MGMKKNDSEKNMQQKIFGTKYDIKDCNNTNYNIRKPTISFNVRVLLFCQF